MLFSKDHAVNAAKTLHCQPPVTGNCTHPAWGQRGVTLIELMVAMVLGLVIMGVMIAVYSNSSGATRVARAHLQMSEDGQYAINVLAEQIRLAAFNPIQPGRTQNNPLPGDANGSMPVFGCDTGFQNGNVAGGTPAAANAAALVCNGAAAAGGHALALTYEADQFNTVPTAGGLPTDCLGTGLVQQLATDLDLSVHPYFTAENRFYVRNNSLYCAGSGGAISPFSEQPIVENVERIELSYGVSHPTDGSKTVAGFLTSAELGRSPAEPAVAPTNAELALLPNPNARWAKVVSVRVCVLMRSADKVADGGTHTYFGCDGPQAKPTTITSSDGFLRRAFITTVAVRNRMAVQE
jgi:type IV pilus assembly protein PilW